MCPRCTFSLLRGRVKYQAEKCLKQAQSLVNVFVACFVKVALKQARNYCNGEGCSCVLHEVVRAFVPVEIIYVLARSQNTF